MVWGMPGELVRPGARLGLAASDIAEQLTTAGATAMPLIRKDSLSKGAAARVIASRRSVVASASAENAGRRRARARDPAARRRFALARGARAGERRPRARSDLHRLARIGHPKARTVVSALSAIRRRRTADRRAGRVARDAGRVQATSAGAAARPRSGYPAAGLRPRARVPARKDHAGCCALIEREPEANVCAAAVEVLGRDRRGGSAAVSGALRGTLSGDPFLTSPSRSSPIACAASPRSPRE